MPVLWLAWNDRSRSPLRGGRWYDAEAILANNLPREHDSRRNPKLGIERHGRLQPETSIRGNTL